MTDTTNGWRGKPGVPLILRRMGGIGWRTNTLATEGRICG